MKFKIVSFCPGVNTFYRLYCKKNFLCFWKYINTYFTLEEAEFHAQFRTEKKLKRRRKKPLKYTKMENAYMTL